MNFCHNSHFNLNEYDLLSRKIAQNILLSLILLTFYLVFKKKINCVLQNCYKGTFTSIMFVIDYVYSIRLIGQVVGSLFLCWLYLLIC